MGSGNSKEIKTSNIIENTVVSNMIKSIEDNCSSTSITNQDIVIGPIKSHGCAVNIFGNMSSKTGIDFNCLNKTKIRDIVETGITDSVNNAVNSSTGSRILEFGNEEATETINTIKKNITSTSTVDKITECLLNKITNQVWKMPLGGTFRCAPIIRPDGTVDDYTPSININPSLYNSTIMVQDCVNADLISNTERNTLDTTVDNQITAISKDIFTSFSEGVSSAFGGLTEGVAKAIAGSFIGVILLVVIVLIGFGMYKLFTRPSQGFGSKQRRMRFGDIGGETDKRVMVPFILILAIMVSIIITVSLIEPKVPETFDEKVSTSVYYKTICYISSIFVIILCCIVIGRISTGTITVFRASVFITIGTIIAVSMILCYKFA
jgi:hypothetical protein